MELEMLKNAIVKVLKIDGVKLIVAPIRTEQKI